MPSFGDSIFIFILALLLFGPKKLPVLARELGKWLGEFRRASNEFKMQMEDELRMSEQADRQKEIAAIQAAAPPTPVIEGVPTEEPEHPHLPAPESTLEPLARLEDDASHDPAVASAPQPLPIASSGEVSIMPPSTGLPSPRTREGIGPLVDAIPSVETPDPETESAAHGS